MACLSQLNGHYYPTVTLLALLNNHFFGTDRILCKADTYFDKDRTMVWFSPYVNIDHYDNIGSLDVPSIMRMVNVIASKFDKIVMEITAQRLGHAESLIPEAVATYNKLYRNSTTSTSALQLYMHFLPVGNAKVEDIIGIFEFVKNLADQANIVFPNTVVALIVSYSNQECHELESGLELILSNLGATSPYKLGITASMESTGNAYKLQNCIQHATKSSSLLKLQLILVGMSYRKRDISFTQFFEALIQSYSSLKSNLLRNNEKYLHISLLTGYYFNDFGLISFWKLLNNWAIKSNETVIFQEAFDLHFLGQKFHRGWWRIVDKPNYLNASEYEYEEKEQVLAKLNEQRKQMYFPTWQHIIAILVSVGIILLFGTISWGCLYYKRVAKQISAGKSNQNKNEQVVSGGRQCTDGNRGHINIMNHLEYDQKLEVAEENIQIDRHKVLGTGHFGLVCVGNIVVNGVDLRVAVKMSRSTCPLPALKNLLSEIKVLSYLGSHENIATLVGAYTAEIDNNKVYIFTELCANGSLETYLQSFTVKNGDYSESSAKWQELNVQLFRWSNEIAFGMEFLAAKKVIHADLATRNVLLTQNMNAKICDFGLSHRLYNLGSYTKKENAKIPWRWTAPEALRSLTFNEKTDVWSYGVTLWEMYSMGQLPYSNVSTSDELLVYLDDGERLPKPTYSFNISMYNELMLKCWILNTFKRPTFRQLRIILDKLGAGLKH